MLSYHYVPLASAELGPFTAMTFPAYRTLATHPDALVLAVGALADGKPIGLALARPPEGPEGKSELLSLFVATDWRGHGVGTALLARMESLLAEEGAHVVTGTYIAGKASTPGLERILAKRGWIPPYPRMMVFRAELTALERAAWLERAEIDEAFTLVPWPDLDPVALDVLKADQAESPWIPDDLAPWLHEKGCEPATSLALLRDGRIVGWVINHKLSRDTLRFSSGWVRPELQRRGRLLGLYAEAGRRALALGYQRATWAVPYHHTAKVAFAKRWMAPYASAVEESRGSAKLLTPGED